MNTCVLSGITPLDSEIIPDELEHTKQDGHPIGWVEIRVRRFAPNPAWQEIQAVKEAMVVQQLEALPEEHRELAESTVRIQIEAMFAALEDQRGNEAVVMDEEFRMIASTTRENDAPGLTAAQRTLFEQLELDWLDVPDDEGESEPDN
jgi:hypothetical protein